MQPSLHGASSCPSDAALAAFVEGDESPGIAAHLLECSRCSDAVAALDSVFSPRDSRPGATDGTGLPVPGDLLGRYRILERVGAGAMGVVYSAFDPELQRRVAIKRLHRPQDPRADELRARFVKEARAVAALAHPNVIAVHDVGIADSAAFFAMEFVEGTTLRQWLTDERPLTTIVDVLRDAGRGLAAAHQAGLVHRDFKPDNVLVGDDGRARVIDFGLVRHAEGWSPRAESQGEPEASGDALTTRAGTLMGTPAYMAPEQLAGAPADARADQFAFCVTLYEAVLGRRPFLGGSLVELDTAIKDGLPAWPTSPRLPRSLQAVLRRGLSADPDDRYPSMDALLGQLRPRPLTRTVPLAAGLGLLGVAVGVYGLVTGAGALQCRPPRQRMERGTSRGGPRRFGRGQSNRGGLDRRAPRRLRRPLDREPRRRVPSDDRAR